MDSKTPVALLQEFLMKKGSLPTYTLIVNLVGTHNPVFKYEVSACRKSAVGTGSSKKEAKHDAARILLQEFKKEEIALQELADTVKSPYAAVCKDNAVGQLQDFCLEQHTRMPDYTLIRDEGLAHAKIFSFRCRVSSLVTEATARTKKQAKHLAAQNMIAQMKRYFKENSEVSKSAGNEEKSLDLDLYLDEVDFEEANKIAMGEFEKLTNRQPSVPLGMEIKDFFKFYEDDSFPKSDTLKTIRECKDKSYKCEPKKIFEKILSELTCVYERIALPSKRDDLKIISIEIKSDMPSWILIGTGPNSNLAEKDAFIKSIEFFITMSKT